MVVFWFPNDPDKSFVKRIIGLPGDTVFPDFTEERVQEWWADHVAAFLKSSAVDGAWLDMNDPSTGWCDQTQQSK